MAKQFSEYFLGNFRQLCNKSYFTRFGETEAPMLCWAVTDTIEDLLAEGKVDSLETRNPKEMVKFLEKSLNENELVHLIYDSETGEHTHH